jgi:hypothetical protein
MIDFRNSKTKGFIMLALPVIIITAAIYYFELFIEWPPIDIPAHLLGGATITIMLLLIFGKKPKSAFLTTFGLLVLWEIFEGAGWRLFPGLVDCRYLICNQDIFFWDGFFDLFFGMIAAAIVVLVFVKWYMIKENR